METQTRVALITGASEGLGRELARLIARRGYDLILTARRPAPLQETAAELQAHTEVLALAGDVADSAHAEGLVRAGLARFGRVDVLVNNASALGPSPLPPLADYPLEALPSIWRTNVVAPLHL